LLAVDRKISLTLYPINWGQLQARRKKSGELMELLERGMST
jgi:hypothetical protein